MKKYFSVLLLSGERPVSPTGWREGQLTRARVFGCIQEKTGTNPRVWQVKKRDMGNFRSTTNFSKYPIRLNMTNTKDF